MKLLTKLLKQLISRHGRQLLFFVFEFIIKKISGLFTRKKTKPKPVSTPIPVRRFDVAAKKHKRSTWKRNYQKRRYKCKMPEHAYRFIGLKIYR